MQEVYIRNNLFNPENFKYVEVNKTPAPNAAEQNNFSNCLRNASNILASLEKSLQKTCKYEQKLLKCKRTHYHIHKCEEESEDSECKEFKSSSIAQNKQSRTPVGLAESWSTISMVCLQYQYEELSTRYESLLQAYDERCSALIGREAALLRLRKRMNKAQIEVAHLNKTVLSVGDKYLALKCKRMSQESCYKQKIVALKQVICEILAIAEQARLALDKQLELRMVSEHDAAVALLLAEIKKCNFLVLENLRLKTKIEEITLG